MAATPQKSEARVQDAVPSVSTKAPTHVGGDGSEGAQASFTKIELACHCASIKVHTSVPTSSLPIAMEICHCRTCRACTGQLCVTTAELPSGATQLEMTDDLAPKGYKSSVDHERFFCPTCGTSLFEHSHGVVFLNTGAIRKVKTEDGALLIELKTHIWVGDTEDGGIRDLLTAVPAWEGWAGKSEEIPKKQLFGPLLPPVVELRAANEGENLKCSCHCGGVRFEISRPNEASANAIVNEHLDLTVPWYEHPSKRPNTNNEPFWLRDNRTKYLAGLCVCDDCRTASGQEVQGWSWIPYSNVHMTSSETLKRYKGSKRAWREFCEKCGATVFFGLEKTKGAREVVDVSIGLMHSQRGARAEDWLDWHTERLSYEDLADNEPFAAMLGSELRSWGADRKSALAAGNAGHGPGMKGEERP